MTTLSYVRRFSWLAVLVTIFYVPFAYSAPATIGQMLWVNGAVRAIGADTVTRNLQRRSAIYEQDTIVTGDKGSGEIVFTDNSMVTLRSGTTFRIDQYKFSKADAPDNSAISSVAKGGFRTITGLISKGNPDSYQVNTPVATIGVRGTDYSVFYSPKGLYVKLTQGKLFVSNRAGKLELDQGLERVYASIQGLGRPPELLKQEPDVFNGQPGITKTSWSELPASIHGGGGPASGGIGTAGSGKSGGGGGTTNDGGGKSGAKAGGGGTGSAICVTP